jgi:hypothetical protein
VTLYLPTGTRLTVYLPSLTLAPTNGSSKWRVTLPAASG